MTEDIAGTWSTVEIAGRTADLFEPANGDCWHAVIFLHDHDLETLKDNVAVSSELAQRGLLAVCPHGARSWWMDIVCSDFDGKMSPMNFLREHVTAYIGNRWNIHPPMIGLTGVGMGGQGALQLAYCDPREFPVVAAIAPAVDFQNWYGRGLPLDELFPNREAARQATATLQLHPLNWPRNQLIVCDPEDEWFEGAERLTMKLSASGIPFDREFELSVAGSRRDYLEKVAPTVFSYLVERLEIESRRAGSHLP